MYLFLEEDYIMGKLFIILGGSFAFLSVVLGAFGAHGLKNKLTKDMLDIFQTGVHYQMVHALGLIGVGILLYMFSPSPSLHWSGWAMVFGIVIFSGSLYVLSLSGIKWLGAITPIGGILFLVGWLMLVFAAFKF